jgi:hypothetical protein
MVIAKPPFAKPGAVTMDCSTSLTYLPILPRLPRGLVFLLILSLLLQCGLPFQTYRASVVPLPALTSPPGRRHRCRIRSRISQRATLHRPSGDALKKILPRLCVRSVLLATLLHTSGWLVLTPWAGVILCMPLLQTWLTYTFCAKSTQARFKVALWTQRLQRL